MKQTSGFESLIDALKQSGFDMGAGFGGPQSGPTARQRRRVAARRRKPFGGGAGNRSRASAAMAARAAKAATPISRSVTKWAR